MGTYVFITNIVSECDAPARASTVAAARAGVGAEGECAHVDALGCCEG